MNGTIISESRTFPYLIGPKAKPLFEYIQYLDFEFLQLYGMIVTSPLDIRNTVVDYLNYTPDMIVHNRNEHWIHDIDGIINLLDDPRDDCDGMAIFTASWLNSVGNSTARLCVGRVENGVTPIDRFNHMWVLLYKDGVPYLIETVGDKMIDELPRFDKFPNYKLFYSASAITRQVYSHV